MKKQRIKKVSLILLTFIYLFLPKASLFEHCSAFESVAQLESYSSNITISKTDYYGRGALAALDNSEELIYAYDKIAEGVEASAQKISLYNGKRYISQKELSIVLDAYRRDYSEHFWLGNEYTMTTDINGVLSIKPQYLMTGEELQSARAAFDNAIAAMLIGVDAEISDFEKELYLHDALARSVEYTESQNAHNAYGALVEGKAVCEGYAEALQCLLRGVGIESYLAHGSSYNSKTGASEPHAWNYVKLGGKFYHTDLTWNDQGDTLYHAYFNLSDTAIEEDHIIDAAEYALPVCDSEDMGYFKLKGGSFNSSTYTVQTVADRLLAGGGRESFYINDNVASFKSWFESNILDIAEKMNVSGAFSYNAASLGREVMVAVNYCKHLHLKQVEPKESSCTLAGVREHYVCMSCNRYFTDSSATQEIIDKNSVISLPKGHKYSEKIFDEAHIKEAAEDCKSFNVYWYDCAECDSISSEDFFASDKEGPHALSLQKGDAAGHYEQCEKCNKVLPASPHMPSAAEPTDTEAVVCVECGYIITPALSHLEHTASTQWSHDSDSHWHSCIGCEEKKFDINLHLYDNECDTSCNVCSAQRITEHRYEKSKYDSDSHWNECACGKKSDAKPHIDENNDGECDECEYGKNILGELYQNLMNKLQEYGISPPMLVLAVFVLSVLIFILAKVFKGNR